MKIKLSKVVSWMVIVIIVIFTSLVVQPLLSNRLSHIDVSEPQMKHFNPNNNIQKLSETHTNSPSPISYLDNNLGIKTLHSGDLYAYALELLDLAKQGNSEAQYWLFHILIRCGYSIAFREDEMREFTANSLNAVQREFIAITINKCYAFNIENIVNFGKPEVWLEKAEKSKYPAANLSKIVLINKEQPTKELVLKAIASGDINVLVIFAEIIENPEEKSSWRLAVCRLAKVCNSLSLDFLFPGLLVNWCEKLEKIQQSCSLDISLQKIYLEKFGKEKYKEIEERADYFYSKIVDGTISERDLQFNY